MEGCDEEERDAHMETEVNGSEPEPRSLSRVQVLSDSGPNRTFSRSTAAAGRPAGRLLLQDGDSNPSLHATLLAIFPEKSGVKFTPS